MNSDEFKDLASELLEELVIARGIIKEICAERGITPPSSSLNRIESSINRAKKELSD